MWFRLRRRRQPPPVLLPSLDRLSELVERVVGLLAQAATAPEATVEPETPREHIGGHVLFVASTAGYRLLDRDGVPPARGDALVLDGAGAVAVVLRLGPSPLPGDRRRCAFVERQERVGPERSFDG